jgi:hypothetical protein
MLATNALIAAFNLQIIIATFVNCSMTALRETITIVMDAEYVALQTIKSTNIVTFATRVSLTAINRTFVERMFSITSARFV